MLLVLFYPSILHPDILISSGINKIIGGADSDKSNCFDDENAENTVNAENAENAVTAVNNYSKKRASDFPSNTGRDGQEVLDQFNEKYPNYQIEIIQESDDLNDLNKSLDALDAGDQIVKPDRITMFVNETGKVTRMYIG